MLVDCCTRVIDTLYQRLRAPEGIKLQSYLNMIEIVTSVHNANNICRVALCVYLKYKDSRKQ